MITTPSIFRYLKVRCLAKKMLQENLHGTVRLSNSSLESVYKTWRCNGFMIETAENIATLFEEARQRIGFKHRKDVKTLVMQLTLKSDTVMDDLIDIEDFTDWLTAENDNVIITWGLTLDDDADNNKLTLIYSK